MNSNIKILPWPYRISTILSLPCNYPFYFNVSNTGENITCQDPIIGVGEPGKVIQKLCRFSNIPSSPDSPVGGIITYKCVGSQWEEKRNDCIFAPVNSLLQMAKVILKASTLSSWWGNLSGWSYFSALRKIGLVLLCVAPKLHLFVYFQRRCNPRNAHTHPQNAAIQILRQLSMCSALRPARYLNLDFSVPCVPYLQGAAVLSSLLLLSFG